MRLYPPSKNLLPGGYFSRLPIATDADARFIIVCNEGYSSSLAAATLQEVGLRSATDLIGGFQA